MKSSVTKRSIVVGGHKTSVSLEDAFWESLRDIARGHYTTVSALAGEIDTRRTEGNLSSALRLFVLDHYRTRTMVASALKLQPGAMIAAGSAVHPSL
jgi:predicted DNA-binding ribbon-helix-helix protein